MYNFLNCIKSINCIKEIVDNQLENVHSAPIKMWLMHEEYLTGTKCLYNRFLTQILF